MAKAKKKQQQDDQTEQTAEVAVDAATVTIEETPALTTADITPQDVRLIEAMLFASSTPLTVGAMAERFPADRVSLIPDILDILKDQYAARGVNIVQRDNRWALRTATDLADNLRLEKEQPKKFTRAAMETMAVVAYHQPVTRAEIENIRGVATSPGALDALMEAGWIKPGKRREVPGRPVTWLTTQAFLDHFGLERLEDLPGMEELKAAGLLDKRPAIEAMPTADMFEEGAAREDIDPNEVTDEDLIGKSDTESELTEEDQIDSEDSEDDIESSDDADDDEDFDDEDEDDDDDFDDEDDAEDSEQEDKE
jgi:segregation and condensation protein B